jgi:hypothetical protein
MAVSTSPDVEFDTRSSQPVTVRTISVRRPLPVREILVEPLAWERIAVSAGIDREARELSEAETLLADFQAGRG